MTKQNSKKYAYSLLEIIIVIGVTGVLFLSTFSVIKTQFEKTRDTQRKSDLLGIQQALESYYHEFGCYPVILPDCSQSFIIGTDTEITQMMCDPQSKESYIYTPEQTNCPQYYQIYTLLERQQDPQIDIINCNYGCGPGCDYNFGITSSNTRLDRCEPTQILLPTEIPSNTPIPVTPTSITITIIEPSITPSPSTTIPTITPKILLYVCAPGGGQSGSCEVYDNPLGSKCPKVYPNDPTCQNECHIKANRCKNSSGKHYSGIWYLLWQLIIFFYKIIQSIYP